MLNGRLRTDEGWSDITICNVSSRGLMVKCATPPPRGAFVEVRRGGSCIVGHVRWVHGIRFGLRSQERIDVAALGDDQGPRKRVPSEERRTAPRTPSPPPLSVREDRARATARLLDWTILAVAAVAAATLVTQTVSSTLSAPLQQTRTALAAQH
jgi:hypothetical protein